MADGKVLKGPWGDKNPLAVLHFTVPMVNELMKHPEILSQAVKSQFRQMAFVFPPDRTDNQQRSVEINDAYAFLMDEEKRKFFWNSIVKEFLGNSERSPEILQQTRRKLQETQEENEHLKRQLAEAQSVAAENLVDRETYQLSQNALPAPVQEEKSVPRSPWLTPFDYWVANAGLPEDQGAASKLPWLRLFLPGFVRVRMHNKQEQLLFLDEQATAYTCRLKDGKYCAASVEHIAQDTVRTLVKAFHAKRRDQKFTEQSTFHRQRATTVNAGTLLAPRYKAMLERFKLLKDQLLADNAALLRAIVSYTWWPEIVLSEYASVSDQANWEEYMIYKELYRKFRDLKTWRTSSIKHRLDEVQIDLKVRWSSANKAVGRRAPLPLRSETVVRISHRELCEHVRTQLIATAGEVAFQRVVGSLPNFERLHSATRSRLAVSGVRIEALGQQLPTLRPLLVPNDWLVGVNSGRDRDLVLVRCDNLILATLPLSQAVIEAEIKLFPA